MNKLQLNRIQYKFWMDNLLKYPSVEYNNTNYTFIIDDSLSLEILKQAYYQILNEYPPLRSVIKAPKGTPFFLYDAIYSVPFTVIEHESKLTVDGIISRYIHIPFNLETDFPCRFYAIHCDNHYYLVHVFHHLVIDGLSFQTFFDRLGELYHDLLNNIYYSKSQIESLDAFNKIYEANFIEHQESDVVYWKNYINDIPLSLTFPKINRKELQSGTYYFKIGTHAFSEVQNLCKITNITLFRLYSVVWALTLAKCTSTNRLLVDHTLNVKPKKYKELLGTFVNNLPIRFDFENQELSVLDILRTLNSDLMAEKRHQYAFYHQIFHDTSLKKENNQGGINVSISYPTRYNSMDLKLSGCDVRQYGHIDVEISHGLALLIEDDEEQSCVIRYSKQVAKQQVSTLANLFKVILGQIFKNPSIKIKDLELLSAEDKQIMLDLQTTTLNEAEFPQTFFSRFQKVVRTFGNNIAAEYGSQTITYKQIDVLSNQIASYLQKLGLCRSRIGVSTPKNLEMLAIILGILKSGNSYVPIDYNLPIDRIRFMIEDCHLAILLGSAEACSKMGNVIPVVDLYQLKDKGGISFKPKEIDAQEEAYVIYTSGTTGKPKAIPILHSMLNQMIVNTIKILSLSSTSRVSQFANTSFDGSIYEIFPILNVGGCLVLPNESERKDPEMYHSFLGTKHITISYIPPVLLASMPHKKIPGLETIVVAGDTTPQKTIEYWGENYRLLNSYGPTENSVGTTYTILTKQSMPNDIGNPEPGVTCYVLDKSHKLLPNNVIGELYIGGVKLSKGYINRSQLNQERFISNPFMTKDDIAKNRNKYIYNTGDLVIRRDDGHLLFMGRSDFQVKFNGYRIELEDIEAQIIEYDSNIRGTVITLYEEADHKQLVAYLKVENTEEFNADELRMYLLSRLPIYMVPSIFIPIHDFPYNSNGKIDRKRLPIPSAYHKIERKITELKTDTEKEIAELWRHLLLGQEVGRDDDFVSLGGDSLSIIHMSFDIEELLGVSIKVSEIYGHPTLKELAAFVDLKLKENKDNLDHIVSSSLVLDDHVYLSPTQMSLWLQCVQSDQIKDVYNLPCIFDCPKDTNIELFEKTFNRLVQLQDCFRTTFPIGSDGRPYIHVNDYKSFSISLYYINNSELPTCLQQDLNVSFNLSEGPLFKVKLYKLENQRLCCSLIMHHLISDGWSASLIESVVLRSLSGQPVDWKQYEGSYTSYAIQSNAFVLSSAYKRRMTYWENNLSDVVDLEFLGPRDNQHSDIRGNVYMIELQDDVERNVRNYCKRYGYTLFDFYIAVYLLLLSRISGQSNIAIGFPYSGREKREFKHILGYFVHTLPLCCWNSYHKLSFGQFIREVRQQIVDTQENSIPLEDIVKIARSVTGNPNLLLIQTMFTMEEERTDFQIPTESDKPFGLIFSGIVNESHTSFKAVYQYACFSEDEIRSLMNAFISLTKSVIDNPEINVLDYSLISKIELEEIRLSNSCMERLSNHYVSFMDRFENVIRRTPSQLAVTYKDLTISYQELDEASTKIADYIQSLGIVHSSSIAVNMIPSINTVITILGIIKANCIYVPIEVELSEQRRSFILQDAACVMCFDDENYPLGKLLQNDVATFDVSRELTNIAYIIYTSGTTGIPKGVPITRASLSYMIESIRNAYKLSSASRYMLFSSISFDVSIVEIFSTLAIGGTLVIAPQEIRKDQSKLISFLEEERITCASIPPAMVSLLPQTELPLLRTLIVGGESSADPVLKFWSKGHRLINAYGPTENTVVSTLCVVKSDFETNDIGLPLPGVTCYVLDKHLNIVPNNTRGDLYIGGVQLTPGYLNRPELNQEKFIENPFVLPSDKKYGLNTVLYKSGDIVMRRPNGHLIFMGRSDRQVKLRGFRIELADIESHLMQCDGVERAVVKIHKGNKGDELVAFVQSERGVNPEDLQSILRQKLPIYMVPVKWAVMAKFPMTVNGKTDWKKVPVPELVMRDTMVTPETEDERLVLSLVCDIMGTDAIGVETDLLNAGMTSMQVMELVASSTNCPHLRFTIPAVYRSRTIRKIIQDHGSKLYFWASPYKEGKLVLVLICGFGYYKPFYDRFIDYFKDKFNIFVFESFREYFSEQIKVTTDVLLNHYLEVIKSVLHDVPVYAVTGYCMGSELAIRFASLLQKENLGLPKVLMMEGVLNRKSSKEVNYSIIGNNEQEVKSFDLLPKLFRTYTDIDFSGDLIIALALHPSRKVTTSSEKVYDDETYERLEKHVAQNMKDWEKAFPYAPFLKMEAEHLNFFERISLDRIWNAVKKYWNLTD